MDEMAKQLKVYRGYIGRLDLNKLLNKDKILNDYNRKFPNNEEEDELGLKVLILTIISKDPYIKLNEYIIKKSPF